MSTTFHIEAFKKQQQDFVTIDDRVSFEEAKEKVIQAGFSLHENPENTDSAQCLYHDQSGCYLWMYGHNGNLTRFERWGNNYDVEEHIEDLEDALGIRIHHEDAVFEDPDLFRKAFGRDPDEEE